MSDETRWHWRVSIRRPFGALAPELRRAMRTLLRVEGARWHKESLPKHFTEQGAAEYRYARRARKYSAKKWQVYFLLRSSDGKKVRFFFDPDVMKALPRPPPRPGPLVVTGRTRKLARGYADIKASSRRVDIAFPVMPYIKWRGPGPDKAKELTTISAKEAHAMARRIERGLPAALLGVRSGAIGQE